MHFLGVGTPGLPDNSGYDLSQVFGAVGALAPHLTEPALIVGKSTVPPGTTARLIRAIRASAPAADAVEVAWNPEFLREGHAVEDTLHPDRIVVGVPNMAVEATIRELYRPLTEAGIPLLTTDAVTAELVKGAANAFLATKVSFINAMADVCAKTGGDVATLADAVGMDARIGRAFLTAGIGYGGGCLPKDVRGLAAFAASAGARVRGRPAGRGRRDQLGPPPAGGGPDPDAPRRPFGQADRAVGRGVQARHRRRARLALAGRGRPPVPSRRAGRGLRPAGGGQRPGRVPAPRPGQQPAGGGAGRGRRARRHGLAAVRGGRPRRHRRVAANRLIIDACQGISAGQWRAEGWTVAAPFPSPNRQPERSRLPQDAAPDSR